MVSALALKYLKMYLCNIEINSCSLNMPLTLTICFDINPTLTSYQDISVPRKKLSKGWRKLCTNNFQENRCKESKKEKTTSKSSPFHQEATDQKDKQIPEFILKPSMCHDAQDTRGVDVRLGCFCHGVSGYPWWAPRGRMRWRGTPCRPWQALGGDTCNCCDTARGHIGVCGACSLHRAHKRFLVCFQTEFTAVNSHAIL